MSYAVLKEPPSPPPVEDYLDPAGIVVELLEVEDVVLTLPTVVELPSVNEEFFIDPAAYDEDELDLLEAELAALAAI